MPLRGALTRGHYNGGQMKDFIRQCRSHFLYAGIFSFFVNILLLSVPLYMLQVYDRVLTSQSIETLWLLTAVAVGAILVYLVLEFVRGRLLMAAGITLECLATPTVLSGVLAQAEKSGGGDYARGIKDIATVRSFLSGPGIVALFDAPWFPVFLAVIYLFHWQLGVTATVGCLLILGVAVLNESATRDLSKEVSDKARTASRYVDVGVRNAEVINVLGMQAAFRRKWQDLNDNVIDGSVTLARRSGMFTSLIKFLRLFLQVTMLAVGASLVVQDHLSGGVMLAATLLLSRASAPVEGMVSSWKALVDACVAYRRLTVLIKNTSAPNHGVVPDQIAGNVQLEKVSFLFPGSDRPVLKSVSLQIPAGEAVGVIGPSASGKSTLARLIAGSRSATQGNVRIDGADIAQWPREHLGAQLGYVPQDVQLVSGTVAENIARFSKASAADIMLAAQRAHAHDMIQKLPMGYETDVGEGGARLSGGQRQMIAIARALFRSPKLVILDEPNSNLDGDAETHLTQVIRELKESGTTVIVVSHRPSLLSHVDKLLLLREGQIDLFGPRNEVLARLNSTAVVPIKSQHTPIKEASNS